MLDEYKKTTEEQRKKTDEARTRAVENSAFTVAVVYDSYPTTRHKNVISTLGREAFLSIFVSYDRFSLPSLTERFLRTGEPLSALPTISIPPQLQTKIVYYDSKYESKAREIQPLIKQIISIDDVELGSYKPARIIAPSSLEWQIEVSFPSY